MQEYVTDKRSGVKQDIPTEQKEFEKSLKELKFRPDIAKSQLTVKAGVTGRKSPTIKQYVVSNNAHLLRKSPTASLGSPLSRAYAKQTTSSALLLPRQKQVNPNTMFSSKKTLIKTGSSKQSPSHHGF